MSVTGANPDTLTSATIFVTGNIASTDVDTIALYRDGNKSGRYEPNQDTFIGNLPNAGGSVYTGISFSAVINGSDSFVFTISLEDTASFADTFQIALSSNSVGLANTGSAPATQLDVPGIWTVNAGIDTSGPNVWYVNDNSTSGDSFTSSVGADYFNGLTIQTPRRNITMVTPFLTAGDTIYIDAGLFDSIVQLVPFVETAAIHIDTNGIFVIGKDSLSTIIDPIGSVSDVGLFGIYADTQSGLTIRNLGVRGAWDGIHLRNVGNSLLFGDSVSYNGQNGIYLTATSDTNTIANNISNSNLNGIYIFNASRNNTVSNNLASANTGKGITLATTADNNFLTSNNASSNSSDGIYLNAVTGNSLTSNTANGNGAYGIEVNNSTNNTLDTNTAMSNASHGIILATSSSGNTLTANEASVNTANYGIYISSSNNNTLRNNKANGNTHGIYIFSSSGITAVHNSADSNSQDGFHLDIATTTTITSNDAINNARYQVYIDGASATTLFSKNNLLTPPSTPDSAIFNNSTSGSLFTSIRNWFGTRDSSSVRNKIWGPARDSVPYSPYRLGGVDTASGADTTAPDAPDTVVAVGLGENQIRVTWGAVTTQEEVNGGAIGLGGYRIYRSTTQETSNWVLRGDVSSGTQTFDDSGLASFESQYYRITAYDVSTPENQSFYSDSTAAGITADTTPPNAFTLIAPAVTTDTNIVTLIFSWNASSDSGGISGYKLQVDTVLSFFTPFIDSATGNVTSCTRVLPANDSYFWRIIAIDNALNTTVSTSRTLRVDTTLPTTVTLNSPPAGYDTSNLFNFFQWSASSDNLGGVYYRFQIDTSGVFSAPLYTEDTTVTSLIRSNPANDTYYWRVVAIDSATNQAPSATRIFRIDTAPPSAAAVPTLPATNYDTSVTTITFTWSAAVDSQSGIRRYRIQADTSGTFAASIYDTFTSYAANDSRTFAANDTYYWRIVAEDSAGNTSNSGSRIFRIDTTLPSVVVPIVPPVTADTNLTTVQFAWNAAADSISGLSHYRIQIDTSGVYGSPLVDSIVAGSVTTCSRTLSANDTYYWRVLGVDTAGNINTNSFNSSILRIDTTTPQTFVTNLPTANYDTNVATIEFWFNSSADSISGLSHYRLQIDTQNTFASLYVDSVVAATVNNCSRTLAVNDTYYWRIVAVDAATNTFASTSKQLRIDTTGVSAPGLMSPSAGHDTNNTNITFTWAASTAVTGVSYYRLQVDTTSSFATPFIDSQTPLTSGARALPANDTYFWRVVAVDNAGNTNAAAPRRVRVDTAGPNGIVTLLAPLSNSDTRLTTVSFSWAGGSDAFTGLLGYRLQVDTANTFATPLVDSFTPLTSGTRTLTANDTYYWRILAVDSATNTAATSSEFFRVDTAPPTAPSLLSPATGHDTNVTTFSFLWGASVDNLNLADYRFQLATTGTFASIVADSIFTSVGCSQTFAPNDTYYWRVIARDSAGNADTSVTRLFRVDTSTPSVVVLATPATNSDTNLTTINLSWNAASDSISGLQKYRLQIDTNAIFSAPIVDSVVAGTVTTTSRTLAANDTYWWRIIAVDTATNTSTSASNIIRIDTTTPSVVTQISPANGLNTSAMAITFTWNAASDSISGVRKYRLQVDTQNIFSVLVADSFTTATSQAVTLATNDSYFWRVITEDSAGNMSVTASYTFRADNGAPSAPGLVLPAAGSDTSVTSILFTWTASADSSGINGYRLQIDTTSAFMAPFIDSFTPLLTATRSVPANDSYFWRVIAIDNTLNTTASSFRSFREDTTTPAVTALIAPTTGHDTKNSTITFSWTSSSDSISGLENHTLQIDTNPAFSSPIFVAAVALGTSMQYAAAPNDTYYWRVIARDSAQNTSVSESRIVRIDSVPPSVASPVAPSNGLNTSALTVNFSWSASTDTLSGVKNYRLQVDTANTFASLVIDSVTTSTSQSVAFATADSYYWRIVTNDSATNASTSSSATFRIDQGGPSAPGLLVPGANEDTNNTTITFTWAAASDSSGISGYRIQIDTSSSFTAPLVDSFTPLLTASFTKPANDSYYWRVVAIDNSGNTTAATARLFRIDTTTPTAVTQLLPPDNYDTNAITNLTLTWTGASDSISGVRHYRIQIDTSNAFATPPVDSTTPNTYFITGYPAKNDTYYWRIITVDSASNATTGAMRHFRFDTSTPAAFSLTSPGPILDTTATTVTFTWSSSADSISGLAGYRFLMTGGGAFGLDTTIQTTTITLLLPANDTYSWQVNATDSATNVTIAGPRTVRIDTVAPSAAALTGPTANQNLNVPSVLFSWSGASDSVGVASYKLQVDTAGTFVASFYESTVAASQTTLIRTLPANDSYFARVITFDSAGNSTNGSSVFFRIDTQAPVKPTLTAPNDGIETNELSVTFSWTASTDTVSGFAGYRLQVDTVGNFAFPMFDSPTSATSITASLHANDTFTWRVRAADSAGNVAISDTRYFVIDTGTQPAVVRLHPTLPAGANINPVGVDLTSIASISVSGDTTDSLNVFSVELQGSAGAANKIQNLYLYRDVNRDATLDTSVDSLVCSLSNTSSQLYAAPQGLGFVFTNGESMIVAVRFRDTTPVGDTVNLKLNANTVKTGARDTAPSIPLFAAGTFTISYVASTIVTVEQASPVNGSITAVGADQTVIMALTVGGSSAGDTLTQFRVSFTGNAGASAVIDTVALYKDGNQNKALDAVVDTVAAYLPFMSGSTWGSTSLAVSLPDFQSGFDSFLIVVTLRDTATPGDTLRATIPAGMVKTQQRETGPASNEISPATFSVAAAFANLFIDPLKPAGASIAPSGVDLTAVMAMTIGGAANDSVTVFSVAFDGNAGLTTQLDTVFLYRDADRSATLTAGDTSIATLAYQSGVTYRLTTPWALGTSGLDSFLVVISIRDTVPGSDTVRAFIPVNSVKTTSRETVPNAASYAPATFLTESGVSLVVRILVNANTLSETISPLNVDLNRVMSLTVVGSVGDTLQNFAVTLNGNAGAASRLEYVLLYRDVNKNGNFDSGSEQYISGLINTSGQTYKINFLGCTLGVTGADSFLVVLSYRDTATSGETVHAEIPAGSCTTTLKLGGPAIAFAAPAAFTIFDLNPPNPFTLLAPPTPHDTGTTSVNLRWNASSDAGSGLAAYKAQVSRFANFSVLVVDTSTGLARSITPLLTPTGGGVDSFYWRVKAFDVNGNAKTSTDTGFFRLDLIAPSKPTAQQPPAEHDTITSSVSFSWSASSDTFSGLKRYRLQIASDPTFATITTDSAVGLNPAGSLTLASSATYYWRGVAEDTAGNIASTDSRRLTIIGAGPTAPTLTGPADMIDTNSTTVTFSWNASSDSFSTVTGYRLIIDTSSSFAAPAIDSATGLATSATRTLAANRTYYWRIVVTNAASLTTNSVTRVLTTDTVCTVALFSPPDATTTTDSRPTFLWLTNVTGVHRDTFTFQLATDTATPTIVLASTQKTTSFQPGATLAGATYFWRVAAVDTAGNAETTAWRTITIDTGGIIVDTIPPASFALDAPENNFYTNASVVTFKWNLTTDTPSGIAQYKIQVDDDSTFASMLHDTSVGATTDTKALSLPANSTHYWRVIAIDGSANQTFSQTSRAIITDNVAPSSPTPLIRPTSGEDTSVASVAFRFTASSDTQSGIKKYTVQVDTSGTFSAPLLTGEGTTTTIVVTGFSQNTWFWRVIAEDTAGNTTASTQDTFRIISVPPSVPQPVSPISGQFKADTSIAFDWTDAANLGAPLKRYILHASTDSLFASIPVQDTTADTASADTVGGFTAGTWYWRVAAEDTLGNVSSFSGVAHFTVETALPATPSISAPANNTVTRLNTVTFTWTATGSMPSSGLNGYQMQIIDNNSVVALDTFVLTSLTSYSLVVSGFGETTYAVRVRSRSNAGTNGSFSSAVTFAFDFTPPVGVPTLISPKNGSGTTVTAPSFAITGTTDTGPGGTTVRYRFQASRSTNFDTPLTSQLLGSATIFTPTYLFSDSGAYYWRVAAVDTVGNQGAYSGSESFTRPPPPDTTPPIAPDGLIAVADDALNISLTWNKSPSADMDSGGQYNIYWNEGRESATSDTLFKIVAHTTADSYTYRTSDDTILVNGLFYRFKVRAQDRSGNEDRNDVTVGALARLGAQNISYAIIFNPDAGRRVERNGGVQIQARLQGNFRMLVDTITFQFRPEQGGIWWPMKVSATGQSQNPQYIGDESKTVYGMHWDALGDSTFADSFYEIRAIVTNKDGSMSTQLSVANLIEMKSPGNADSDVITAVGADTVYVDQRMHSNRQNRMDVSNGEDTSGSVTIDEDGINPTDDTTQARGKMKGQSAKKSNGGAGQAFGFAIGSTEQNQIDAAIGKDTPIGMALSITLPGGQTTLLNGKFAYVTISYPRLNDSGFVPGTSAKPESLVMRAASEGDADSRQLTILSIDTINRTITARTDRFSTFLLVVPNAGSGGPGNQASLARFMVYPNPWRPNDGKATTGEEYDAANPRTTGIVFDNLPARVRVEVYTLKGERIFDRTTAVNDGFVTWNVRNSGSGERIASGYYIYIVTDLASGQRVTGKLAVIR
ncbi:MAG: right-handed parallel beta-helix repeat-containing protein, partial [Candidatus Hydrogenedentota bacterium]